MIKQILLLLCVLSSTASLAEAPAPAVTVSARPRVLVLTPGSKAFDAATTTTIAGLVTSELSADVRLDIIAADEVERLAALEGDRQNVGCTDNSCLAELAGAIGARYVVFGDVGKLGDVVIVQLNLFDSQTAQALNRVTIQAESMSALPRVLPPRVRELTSPLVSSTTPSPPPASPINAWPWVFIGGGVVVAGVGAAIEATSDVADNGALDVQDALAPALWVVGGAGAVAGVVMLFAGATDAP